jgi:hypothetical protein
MSVRLRNVERLLKRLDDISRQHVHPSERAIHAVQITEARDEALRDLAAALNGANDEERAAINAAIAKIEGKAK